MFSTPVIFDCDGVLVDSEVIYLETDRECLASIGLIYDHTEYCDRFIGLPDVDFYAHLARDFQQRGLGRFPDGFPDVMKAKADARVLKELAAIDGVQTLLQALSGKIAVASSSEVDALETKLRITALSSYFGQHIYSGQQVTHGKPAPDLFLLAAQKLNEAPAGCIVIEDSVNGVKAGCAAGMEVWGFTGGGHADADLAMRLERAGARRVFSGYEQVLTYMRTT